MKSQYTYNPNVPTSPTIQKWESDWKLPEIKGTIKQRKYARDCRHKFLAAILPHILNIRDELAKDLHHAFYSAINCLRAETSPGFWIELHQNKITPIEFLTQQLLTRRKTEEQELLDWLEN